MTKNGSNENWFVIHTTAGKEHMFMAQLRKLVPNDMYDACFMPLRTERRKVKGVYIDALKSLFPGYVFIITSRIDEIFLLFREEKKFLNVLRAGQTFLQISCSEADFLIHLFELEDKTQVDNDYLQNENIRMSTGIITNGKLRVIDGPMVGLEQYVTRIDRHKMKAELEMELFCETRKFTMGLIIQSKD